MILKLVNGYEALIDDEDAEKVAGYTWRAHASSNTLYVEGYFPLGKIGCKRGVRRPERRARLHRLVMGAPQGLEVDHIDGNGLNNQKSNLRLVTHIQNGANQRKRKPTKWSKFKGVELHHTGKWVAVIQVKGKRHRQYGFLSDAEAAMAYNQMALEHFGEFANLNEVPI